MVDDIRCERHYLRLIDREETYKTESWLDLAVVAQHGDLKAHRAQAEKVVRSFDQLGFLVREGRVPVDTIARFNVVPILHAWYALSPYVLAVRKQRGQPSHAWHFENLVYGIMLPGLDSGRGPWRGVLAYDFPETDKERHTWLNVVRGERPSSGDCAPGYPGRVRLWNLRGWRL